MFNRRLRFDSIRLTTANSSSLLHYSINEVLFKARNSTADRISTYDDELMNTLCFNLTINENMLRKKDREMELDNVIFTTTSITLQILLRERYLYSYFRIYITDASSIVLPNNRLE